MKRLALGVLIAAALVYAWGFLVWGLGPYPTLVWDQPVSHDRSAEVLREQFPTNGTYYVPAHTDDQDLLADRFEAGPVAFVHMLHVDGRSMMDPRIMAMGFLLNLVVIVLTAVLLQRAAPALPSYWSRVQFVTLVGLVAVVMIDFGAAVWWDISWAWQCYQAFYDLTFFFLAGLILAKFVPKRPLQPRSALPSTADAAPPSDETTPPPTTDSTAPPPAETPAPRSDDSSPRHESPSTDPADQPQ